VERSAAQAGPAGHAVLLRRHGAWSTYWYDGLIYETNIGEGLNIFKLQGRETRSAIKLGHLNPQTQEFSLDGPRRRR
jgi:hypothetical protein